MLGGKLAGELAGLAGELAGLAGWLAAGAGWPDGWLAGWLATPEGHQPPAGPRLAAGFLQRATGWLALLRRGCWQHWWRRGKERTSKNLIVQELFWGKLKTENMQDATCRRLV